MKTNQFIKDVNHHGMITVRQLVDLVKSDNAEWPLGLDTEIQVGSFETDTTWEEFTITEHAPDKIRLSFM